MKKLVLLSLLFALGFANDFRLKVGVSIAPTAYIVQKIGGKFVQVEIMIPPNKNPSFYQPSIEQIKKIKDLKVFIAGGMPFEKKWLPRFSNANPSIRILNLAPKDCKTQICYNWLSIKQIQAQAKQIAYLLRMIDIKNAQNYKNNLDKFLKELEALSQTLHQSFSTSEQKAFVSYREIWSDFANEFGLKNYVLSHSSRDLPKNLPLILSPYDPRSASQLYSRRSKQYTINPFANDLQKTILDLAEALKGESNGK